MFGACQAFCISHVRDIELICILARTTHYKNAKHDSGRNALSAFVSLIYVRILRTTVCTVFPNSQQCKVKLTFLL